VQDEEVEQGGRPGNEQGDGHEEQVGGVELYGDVEAEVVEDDVGGEEGGEQSSEQAGAAEEDEDAGEALGGAADHLVDGVEADEGPEHGHGRGVAQGLVEHGEGGWGHLQREELGQAVADHGVAEGEAEDQAEPEEEAWVGEGAVGAELVSEGPDEGEKKGEDGHDAEGDPVEDGVAGAGVVEFGADAGEVEEVLAEPLRGVEEGPGGPVFKMPADVEGDDLPESGVAAAEGVDEEIAEAEAEGEAGGEGPAGLRGWRGCRGCGGGFGVWRKDGEGWRGFGLVFWQGSAFQAGENVWVRRLFRWTAVESMGWWAAGERSMICPGCLALESHSVAGYCVGAGPKLSRFRRISAASPWWPSLSKTSADSLSTCV